MKENNKGLSLIELVAVMAIMAIMAIAVIGFMAAGVRQYQEAQSEVSRQQEAQMALNQMKDLLIDTSNGIRYDDTSKEIWAYNTETSGSGSVYVATKINWNASESKLYLSKYTYSVEADGSYTPIVDSEAQLLAENVSDFSADLSEMDTKNVISLTLDITVRGKTYSADGTVKLRDSLKEVADESEAFEEELPELTATVTGVVVTPSTANVWKGSSYSGFQAVVKGVNYPSQDISWSFADGSTTTAGGSSINPSSGIVTVGASETLDSLSIKATSVESKKNNAEESDWLSATANLSIKSINGISLGALSNTTDMSAQAELTVSGVHFEGTEDLSPYISFDITDENGNKVTDIVTSVSLSESESTATASKYILKAVAPASYMGQTISITPKITYNYNRGASEEESAVEEYTGNKQTVTFYERAIVGMTLQIQDEDGNWKDCGTTYSGKRGETLSFRIKAAYGTASTAGVSAAEYETYWYAGDSEWTEYLSWTVQKNGKATSDYGDVSELAGSGSFTIGGLSTFKAASSYTFVLKAEFSAESDSGYGDYTGAQSLTITIPEVSISIQERHDNQSKEFMTVGESQTIHFVVAGLDSSLYTIAFEPVNGSVVSSDNVKLSGNQAVINSQLEGTGNMKFNLLEKSGTPITVGKSEVSVTLPLEIGSKNLYVRTGSFGSYKYILMDGSVYIPASNYSSSGTVVYMLGGTKVTYSTSSTLLGTTTTVKIGDGTTVYTRTSYGGGYIWYR